MDFPFPITLSNDVRTKVDVICDQLDATAEQITALLAVLDDYNEQLWATVNEDPTTDTQRYTYSMDRKTRAITCEGLLT